MFAINWPNICFLDDKTYFYFLLASNDPLHLKARFIVNNLHKEQSSLYITISFNCKFVFKLKKKEITAHELSLFSIITLYYFK